MKMINKESLQSYIEFIDHHSGLVFPDSHHLTICQTIQTRALQLQVTEKTYLNLLKENLKEREWFFNTITINETYFFREEKQFKILLELVKDFCCTKISLWSASCSTGEEAISLSMIAKETGRDYFVMATDINSSSLNQLKKGKYANNSIRQDGSFFYSILRKYGIFNETEVSIYPEILDKINVAKLNLVEDSFDNIHQFHIIFFRNTLVYMNQEIKNKVVCKLVEKLHCGGYLFVSSTEVPFIFHPELKIIEKEECYIFQKVELGKITENKKENSILWNSSGSTHFYKKPLFITSKKALNTFVTPKIDFSKIVRLSKQNEEDISDNEKISKEYQVLRMIQDTCYSLECKKYGAAWDKVMELESYTSDWEVISYFKGYIEMEKENIQLAIKYLKDAIAKRFNFWLPHFYLGMLNKDSAPELALREFLTTKDLLLLELQKHQYSFLLKKHKENYFLEICEIWIDRI